MIELLSNIDIEDICKELSINLIQCTSKDMLTGKPKNGAYIINLQNAYDGGGTHWSTFYIRGNECMYFDSFGEIYPYDVFKFVHQKSKMKLDYSNTQIQDLRSTACGYFCIAFLHHMKMNPNDSLYNTCIQFTNLFNPINQSNNDVILQSLIKKLF